MNATDLSKDLASSIIPRLACCICGISTEFNEAAMCIDCLRANFSNDVGKSIITKVNLVQCGKCDRWHVSGNSWHHHNLESVSLLSLCLKKIPGLQKKDLRLLGDLYLYTNISIYISIFLYLYIYILIYLYNLISIYIYSYNYNSISISIYSYLSI
jgi:hypothetical protein